MSVFEQPTTVVATFAFDEGESVIHAGVVADSGCSKVVECSKHVVVPARRERELQPVIVDDVPRAEPTHQLTVEEVRVAVDAGNRNRIIVVDGILIFA